MRFAPPISALLILSLAATAGAHQSAKRPSAGARPVAAGGFTETILHTFRAFDRGTKPYGVAVDASGTIYGVTAGGGFDGTGCFRGIGCGTAYKLTPSGSSYKFTRLQVFKGTIQQSNTPSSGLLPGANGALYGTLLWTGPAAAGSVYSLEPSRSGYRLHTLYVFQGPPNDGEYPSGGLIADANGALYGTAGGGGGTGCGAFTGCGIVFKLTPSNKPNAPYTETILYRFQGGTDGRYPQGPLFADASGALYGTTQGDGCQTDCGTVFKLIPQVSGTYTETTLHAFKGGADGDFPFASVTGDASGAIYGTTTGGGSVNDGTVFKLTPNGSGYAETIIHNFQGGTSDGSYPESDIVLDATGTVYGTTLDGGSSSCEGSGCGIVFKLTPQGSGGYSETILHDFANVPDGAHPEVIFRDPSGNIYGATRAGGGPRRRGTIYRLSP
jgi:uncharacterized repeat protein (TIGR03803 family)